MATTFYNSWVTQFDTMLRQTMSQQRSLVFSRIGPGAKHSGVSAVVDTWERAGNVLLTNIGRYTDTPVLQPTHDRRGAAMQTVGRAIHLAKYVELVRALLNPQSDYRDMLARAAVWAKDQAILTAAVGSATVVATSPTTGQMTYSSQAMVSNRIIGTTNTAVSLTTIIAAAVLLSKASVPTGPQARTMFYGPGQLVDLLAITQASSSDFTNNRIHDQGFDGISWEGFNWVEIADVVDQTGWVSTATATARATILPMYDANSRAMIAMYNEGVGVSTGQEATSEISPLPTRNYDIQVYVSESYAAVRLWEGAVVEIIAKEN